jgi:hypothetical protein
LVKRKISWGPKALSLVALPNGQPWFYTKYYKILILRIGLDCILDLILSKTMNTTIKKMNICEVRSQCGTNLISHSYHVVQLRYVASIIPSIQFIELVLMSRLPARKLYACSIFQLIPFDKMLSINNCFKEKATIELWRR